MKISVRCTVAVCVLLFFEKGKKMSIDTFKGLFKYDQSKIGYVGIERECFISEWGSGTVGIVPKAYEILSRIKAGTVRPTGSSGADAWSGPGREYTTHEVKPDEFGYELSACQIETRIGPCELADVHSELTVVDVHLRCLLGYDYSPLHTEVGPANMPLDVYPDPTGRYQKITAHMPREVLLAACRVIGTHVHVGMKDHETALRVYNYTTRYFTDLCEIGNGSFGERLAIYRQMAPEYEPKPYKDWEAYYQVASAKGFADDPRKCWTLIRISTHGTIEFRMFGATDSIQRIVGWVQYCHALCARALPE